MGDAEVQDQQNRSLENPSNDLGATFFAILALSLFKKGDKRVVVLGGTQEK